MEVGKGKGPNPDDPQEEQYRGEANFHLMGPAPRGNPRECGAQDAPSLRIPGCSAWEARYEEGHSSRAVIGVWRRVGRIDLSGGKADPLAESDGHQGRIGAVH